MERKQKNAGTVRANVAGETRMTRKEATDPTSLDHGTESLVAVDSPDDPMPSDLEPGT